MTAPVPFESRVRPLIAAATPAPWVRGLTYDTEESFNERGYHLAAVSQADGPTLYASTEFTAPGGVRDPEVMHVNAALVVTAVNTAAASADLAEAVRAYAKALETNGWAEAGELHSRAMLAALARLDSAASSGAGGCVMGCAYCDESLDRDAVVECESCGSRIHAYCVKDDGWTFDETTGEYLCHGCTPRPVTPPLPASLLDADLVPWLVALDYGDEDVMTNETAWRGLAPAYAEKAAAVRALVEKFGREATC